jgi:hypothetical protein
VSYISFFVIVWWIWASQVAYNISFRQADWLHRGFVFLQLMVFAALAAFTNDFDVTSGIASDKNDQLLTRLKLSAGFGQSTIDAEKYRMKRLPRLNARGISITIAASRLVLLAQYLIGASYPNSSYETSNLAAVDSPVLRHENTPTRQQESPISSHRLPGIFGAL